MPSTQLAYTLSSDSVKVILCYSYHACSYNQYIIQHMHSVIHHLWHISTQPSMEATSHFYAHMTSLTIFHSMNYLHLLSLCDIFTFTWPLHFSYQTSGSYFSNDWLRWQMRRSHFWLTALFLYTNPVFIAVYFWNLYTFLIFLVFWFQNHFYCASPKNKSLQTKGYLHRQSGVRDWHSKVTYMVTWNGLPMGKHTREKDSKIKK